MENNTPCRNRHGGLAPKAVQRLASEAAAVRENHAGLAAEQGKALRDLTLAAKRVPRRGGPAGLTRKRRSNENVQVAQA